MLSFGLPKDTQLSNSTPSSSPQKISLLRYSLRWRLRARFLILFVAFNAALAGLASPFFQKVFVDRLVGAAILTHGWSGFAWMETIDPFVLIFIAFVCTVSSQAFGLLANFIGVREGIFLQREYSERLYRKMLSLRSDTMGSTTVGEVVALYATDIPGSTAIVDQAIPMGASIVFPLIFAPLAIQWMTGIPIGQTLAVMFVMIGLNVILATRQSRFFFKFKILAAERTGIVNEWIQNIRLLRILGWTAEFEKKIHAKRVEETENRVAMVTNGQLMNSFGSTITYLINFLGVSALVFTKNKAVTAGELFALLWIFGVFLTRPFRQIPWIFTFSLDSLTSIRRLEKFLNRPSEPEAIHFDSHRVTRGREAKAMGLEIRGLDLEISGQKLLDEVDFSVRPGEFVAVVGEVGSGKTLLVLSLMGETGARFGKFEIGGQNALEMDLNERRKRFAFVPQEGFVMSATLRENVAFSYDAPTSADNDIRRSLAVSQFRIESEHLTDGLDTEIGERGVNLSGGQRQRVSLARAHFFERPVVLLDDCLSAVDVDTESQLIRDLISGAWKNETRVLVTHRLSVLSQVDRIFFMESGRIVESGSLDELMARSQRMRDYVASVKRGEAGLDSGPSKHKPTVEDDEAAKWKNVQVDLERGEEADVETEKLP